MKINLKVKKEKISISPTLNTIIMVEDVLTNMDSSIIKVSELKKILPKKVNHNTLIVILEYLERSNKIAVSMGGISWIQNSNKNLRKEIERGLDL